MANYIVCISIVPYSCATLSFHQHRHQSYYNLFLKC